MDIPLDTATATADLLSDIFLPTLRWHRTPDDPTPGHLWDLGDADLRALAEILDQGPFGLS